MYCCTAALLLLKREIAHIGLKERKHPHNHNQRIQHQNYLIHHCFHCDIRANDAIPSAENRNPNKTPAESTAVIIPKRFFLKGQTLKLSVCPFNNQHLLNQIMI